MKDTYLLSETFRKFMNLLKDTDNKFTRGYIIIIKVGTHLKRYLELNCFHPAVYIWQIVLN